MGGGNTQAPTPPSAGETAGQSIQAQLAALPQIFAAQQQYGPQFTQLQLQNLQQFGPQFAQAQLDLQNQFGGQFAQSAQDTNRILHPDAYAAQQQLAQYFQNGPPQMNEAQQRQSIQGVTSNAALRGLGESGFTATAALSTLIDQQNQMNNQFYGQALGATGQSSPQSNFSGAAPQSFGPGQLVQNVDPGSFFGYQNNLNSMNQSAYQFGQNGRGNLGGLGAGLGMGLGALFAAPTGGLSMLGGAAIGGGIGGGFGSSFRI